MHNVVSYMVINADKISISFSTTTTIIIIIVICYCGVYHLDFWVIHPYVIYSGGSP